MQEFRIPYGADGRILSELMAWSPAFAAAVRAVLADYAAAGLPSQGRETRVTREEFIVLSQSTLPPDPVVAAVLGDRPSVRLAAQELLDACITDMGLEDGDEDDEAVGEGQDGKMAVRFGHLRRLRDALDWDRSP